MSRLQGAMEYLMTYGWAILVIAVVLGSLYQLGVFGSGGASITPSCLAATGFLCQTPVANTSGWVAVKFGQIGTSSITLTGLGCSANVSAPSSTQSVNIQISSGAKTVLQFNCPFSNNNFGTAFKGYLWLTYSTPTQSGISDRFAVLTTKIQTTGNVTLAL